MFWRDVFLTLLVALIVLSFLRPLRSSRPRDDSTLMENGEGYLHHHLPELISEIEGAGDIRLAAIGINHRVERYYKRSITIDSPEQLEEAVVQIIGQLLAAPHCFDYQNNPI
ncbi:conserved hypothetical protein [Bradyrhizobium oligotrophicum S58]|uniref:Cobalamin biosynthesis protein CobT VWA domain-containing protein n=1 Tax=Bradyrhizobium oligotrophicum S58 TaxID=1245469 RepID=M4ZFY8_9BRAD|nr:hypothetical protein [Bradyrhizobium oligotrophicum]BAM92777.1 conserved hypothetical protein [Bradyrhizobium oligotrophicum S58]